MRTIDMPPYAPILMESTRSIGYSVEAAIADVIDNSIAAFATNVKYAIVILAVFGLEKLRKEHSENLWDDLVDLCRCEEFTFFLTFAYRII